MTPDGLWLGGNWLEYARDAESKAGVLEREKAIAALDAELASRQRMWPRRWRKRWKTPARELQDAEARREELQSRRNLAHRQFSDARAQLEARQSRLEQMHARTAALQKRSRRIARTAGREDKQAMDASRRLLHQALGATRNLAPRKARALSAQRDQLRDALETRRAPPRRKTAIRAHELALKNRALKTEQDTTTQNLERMRGQQGHLSRRREELRQAIEASAEPLADMESELAVQLERRHQVEGGTGRGAAQARSASTIACANRNRAATRRNAGRRSCARN